MDTDYILTLEQIRVHLSGWKISVRANVDARWFFLLGLKPNHTSKGGRLRILHAARTIHCNLTSCHLTSCGPRGVGGGVLLLQRRLFLSSLAVTTRVVEGQVNYSSLIYRPASSRRNPWRKLQTRRRLICFVPLEEAGTR